MQIWEKWKYRSIREEGKALVDVYASLPSWKRNVHMGGFASFNDAGEYLLDCAADDAKAEYSTPPEYSVKVNLPKLNPVHLRDRNGYGESVTLWMRVPGTLSDDEAIELWNGLGYDDEGTFCQHSYDCCGRMYHGSLNIKSNGHSTLLMQHYTRNI